MNAPIILTDEAIRTFSPLERQILYWGVERGDILIRNIRKRDENAMEKN